MVEKPINITPILRGKTASKFFKKLENNKNTMPILKGKMLFAF